MTRRRTWAFVGLCVLFAAVVIPIGVHKGEDIAEEIRISQLWLQGQPLYVITPGYGTWWPPFATLTIAPLGLVAMISLTLAKAIWAAAGVLCVGWSLWTAGERWGWGATWLALAAVSVPLYNNFQHQNIEAMLLALLVGIAASLEDRRDTRAGILIGLAVALKAFPALLLIWAACRRRWRVFGTGAAVAAGVTYVAGLRYGPIGAFGQLWGWVELSLHAPSFPGAMGSVLPMQKLARLVYALGGGVPAMGVAEVALVAAVVVIVVRRRRENDQPLETGVVTLSSILLAPIAWLHYFTLALPLWVAAIAHRPPLQGWAKRAWAGGLGVAGLLTSGMLGHFTYPRALSFIPAYNDTVGSLLLIALLLAQHTALRPAGANVPAPTGGS